MLAPSNDLSLISLRSANADAPATGNAAKSARDFEAMFITQMLNTMNDGSSEESEFTGGSSEDTWRSFFNQAAAEEMADKGGFDLAPRLMADIIALQAAQSTTGGA